MNSLLWRILAPSLADAWDYGYRAASKGRIAANPYRRPEFATGGVVPEGTEPFIPEGGCNYIVRTPEHEERVRSIYAETMRRLNEQDPPDALA